MAKHKPPGIHLLALTTGTPLQSISFPFPFPLHLLDAGRLLGVVEGRARGGELHERPDRLDRLVPGQQERRLGGRVLY